METKRGLLLATNSNEVLIISKTGELVSGITNKDFASSSAFGRGLKLKSASGIGYCAMDDKYIVSDATTHCISIIDPNTQKMVFKFGVKGSSESCLNAPMNLAYDGGGTIPAIMVSDHNNHCVKVFTTEGQRIQVYGSKGTDDAQLHNPCGVCVDSAGRILVCDWGNHRVVRFSSKEGRTICECLLSADQLGGAIPRDLALHTSKGLLAVCVALKHGEYNVNINNGCRLCITCRQYLPRLR